MKRYHIDRYYYTEGYRNDRELNKRRYSPGEGLIHPEQMIKGDPTLKEAIFTDIERREDGTYTLIQAANTEGIVEFFEITPKNP